MGAYVLPLTVNSKSERKIDSLPLLGFKPATTGTQAHLSDHLAKSHPQFPLYNKNLFKFSQRQQQMEWDE
jgi:hypothetical protein